MIIVPITGLLWEIKNPLGRRAEKVLKTSVGNEPSRLRVLRAKKDYFFFSCNSIPLKLRHIFIKR